MLNSFQIKDYFMGLEESIYRVVSWPKCHTYTYIYMYMYEVQMSIQ